MTGVQTGDFGLGVPAASVRALLGSLASDAGAFLLDRDLRIVACHGELYRSVGWDPADLEGRCVSDVVPAEQWRILEPHYRAALTGEAQGFRVPAVSGRIYKVIVAPLRPSGADVEGLLVVTIDATRETIGEQRLREAQAVLRTAFDAAATAMVVFVAEPGDFGRVLQANRTTATLFGFEREALARGRLHDVFPPDRADHNDAWLRRLAAEGGEIAAHEVPLVDARGRVLWGRLHVSFIRDDEGRATLGVAQIEDVTRERLREEALRVSEERFGLVFHHAPVGMVVVDLQQGTEGTIVEANDAYAELVGRTPDELIGVHVHELTHPEDAAKDTGTIAGLASGTIRTHSAVKRYVRPDGTARQALLRAAPIHDADGLPRFCIGLAMDVTERVEAEEAHESILESVLEGIVAVDANWRITVFNRAAEQMFGHSRLGVLGRPLDALPGLREAIARAAQGAPLERHEIEAAHADGTHFPIELSVQRTGRRGAELTAFIRDLTAQRRAERRSRGAEDLFRSMFEHSAVAMAVLTLDGRCLEANAEMCRFLGRSHSEMRACTVEDVVHPDERVPTATLLQALEDGALPPREQRFVRPDGQIVWGHVQSTLLRDDDGRSRGVQTQIIDITVHRRTTARLGAVLESLAEGVLVVGEDGLIERINPAGAKMLGRSQGDLVGHAVQALRGGPEAGTCAILRVAGTGEAVRVEDDVFLRGDGTELPVTYSASPLGAGHDRGVVVVFSDISERKAREQGMRRRLEALDRLELTRRALRDERFVLYRQPILDVAAGEVVQEELLLRMRDEDGSIIEPAEFLPVAEEYGLIADIDRWVIRNAALLAAQGRHVEVNVSGQTLGHRELTRWVEESLRDSGADPRLMTFEITETALTTDLEEASRFAERIAELGCGFALDDFGTGYGSFTLLKRLPVSYLKIDRDFVFNLVDEEADRHVVQAVISLARGLGMRTIAEGVEDEATLALLAELGVDYAQGFLIGRPEPA